MAISAESLVSLVSVGDWHTKHVYASAFTAGNDLPANQQTLFGCECARELEQVYYMEGKMSSEAAWEADSPPAAAAFHSHS